MILRFFSRLRLRGRGIRLGRVFLFFSTLDIDTGDDERT